jgi:hypothetical protein
LIDPQGLWTRRDRRAFKRLIQRLALNPIQIGIEKRKPADGTIYSEQTLRALTFTAGAVAAYLMYRRGESPLSIAKNTVLNPIGSLASEIQNTTSENHA